MNLPEGCVFSPRCPYATDKCRKQRPSALSPSLVITLRATTPVTRISLKNAP